MILFALGKGHGPRSFAPQDMVCHDPVSPPFAEKPPETFDEWPRQSRCTTLSGALHRPGSFEGSQR